MTSPTGPADGPADGLRAPCAVRSGAKPQASQPLLAAQNSPGGHSTSHMVPSYTEPGPVLSQIQALRPPLLGVGFPERRFQSFLHLPF